MFRLSQRSLRAMAGINGDLEVWVRRLIEVTPIDFVVLEGLRSLKRQAELVASGASQTMNSRHLVGKAVDLGAWLGGLRWDAGLYYQIADAGRRVCWETGIPIRWGGCWMRLDLNPEPAAELVGRYAANCRNQGRRPFIDSAHFELPASVYG